MRQHVLDYFEDEQFSHEHHAFGASRCKMEGGSSSDSDLGSYQCRAVANTDLESPVLKTHKGMHKCVTGGIGGITLRAYKLDPPLYN